MIIDSMYGTCDGQNIIFKYISRDNWECHVPADLSDGTYVVEIYAHAQTGETIYTTAILYMCDGKVVSLQPKKDNYVVIITDNRHFAKCIDPISVKVKV